MQTIFLLDRPISDNIRLPTSSLRPRCTNVVHDLGSAEPSSSVIGDLNRVQVS